MKQEKLVLETDDQLRHYFVNGSDLDLPDEDLEAHLKEIDRFLGEVRSGDAVLEYKHFEPLFKRKAEIIVEISKRKIKRGQIEINGYVRECLDIKDWDA